MAVPAAPGQVLCLLRSPEDVARTLRELGVLPTQPPSPLGAAGQEQPDGVREPELGSPRQSGCTQYFDMAAGEHLDQSDCGEDVGEPAMPSVPVWPAFVSAAESSDSINVSTCTTKGFVDPMGAEAGTDRMANEAEKFQSEDDDDKLRIGAKSGVENYCLTMRHTLNEVSVDQEAEKFQSEDDDDKLRIGAKSGVENYCFTKRHTLKEESMMGMFELEWGDLETIGKAVQDVSDWLDKNQLAEDDELEAKQKELEGFVNSIVMQANACTTD